MSYYQIDVIDQKRCELGLAGRWLFLTIRFEASSIVFANCVSHLCGTACNSQLLVSPSADNKFFFVVCASLCELRRLTLMHYLLVGFSIESDLSTCELVSCKGYWRLTMGYTCVRVQREIMILFYKENESIEMRILQK